MQPYGLKKRGSGKTHSHNKCATCSESNIEKGAARQDSKNETKLQLKELNG